MGWCGRHQRAFRQRCVACWAETRLRRDRDDALAAWQRAERALRHDDGSSHRWQLCVDGETPAHWECIDCGKRVYRDEVE